MGNFATQRNHKGYEYVVRVVSAPTLGGKTAASSKRKVRGKMKADALEMRYANRIDRKAEREHSKAVRSADQRESRRAKRRK